MIDTSDKKPLEPLKKLTISHEAVDRPSAQDYDRACQDFCQYVRTHLAPYVWKHKLRSQGLDCVNYQSDVMEIMGCLSFVQVIAVNQKTKQGSTDYDHLFDRKHELSLRKAFTKEYCRINKITEESPLQKTIEAGTYAIPKLAKVRRMVKECMKKSNELPVEVDLGPAF